jgi:EmrB/QacA subfamily drug resistance transporter
MRFLLSPTLPRVRWWIFAVVLVADVLDLLDSTVTNIAAPSIVRDLHADSSLVSWLGLSYSLTLGSLLVVGGRLGDRLGTPRTFLAGLVGFTAASLLVASAWSPASIIVSRLVQGCFGALLIPQGFSILLRTFPREQLGRVFGLFGPLLALSSISGPVLAAGLLQIAPFGLGWRAVFAVNGIFGVTLVVLATILLPADRGDRAVRIPVAPSALIVAGLLALLGGVIDAGTSGWGRLQLALVIAGLGLLAGFALQQRQTAEPLLAPGLFRTRSFVTGLITGSVFFAAIAGLLYVTSLYLQDGKGLSPLHAAAVMAPTSLGIILTSFTTRSRVERWGRRLVAAGVALTFTGVVIYLAVARLVPSTPYLLAAPLLVAGLGMGCCFGSFFATALGDIDEQAAGSASGTLNAVQQIARAAGAAIISTLFLSLAHAHNPATALTYSLAAVLVSLAISAATVPLLPRHAAADHH